MRCKGCGLDQHDGNRFCEDCGSPLRPLPAAHARQGSPAGGGPHEAGADRTHLELMLSPLLAGVSDRGKRHVRNEDFLALASTPAGDVLVVCDGVSSSQDADVAAQVAASTACAALSRAMQDARAVAPATLAAIRAADQVVRALPYQPSAADDPPETTLVAAVRLGRRIVVGWLGDSRAYLVTAEGARPLTEDHSWINEVVASGHMTRAEARRAPQAHAITRTAGGRSGPDEPSLRTVEVPPGPARLVLCSDGLWNYLSEPWQLAEVLRRQPPAADALSLARTLVGHALEHEAHDNITAAVLVLDERR
jgi:serine/threonine protein phosphatase PrpC